MTERNADVYRQLYGDSLPIAVIGAGCRFPHADNIVEYWRRIADGEELITRLDAQHLTAAGLNPALLQRHDYVPAASILEEPDRFDWSFFGYARSEAETLDPQQRIFLMCAWEALEMAGYSSRHHNERIGVTGSCRLGTYLQARAEDSGNLASPQVFQKLLGNDKDYLATRVAYKLGLTGPAMTVQTACSSSLVAIHLACEQIASGEADMMLAGGVAISFPQQSGYFYHPGMIFSPDGHCRPFDADAAGTLPGNGAAVVLLKRLESALAAGDPILCVIRATAMNNDGNNKAGFTAPCVAGQRQVITDALTLAEVSPATIGMVEAHGTATPLGDPIEVAALTEAWSPWLSGQRQFCALGSVKSNLGHLDTAAGVASFLKASLAVWQGQIPPSLHFATPNPEIDFAAGPFFVPQMLLPWPDSQPVRRAAVSAFGIGGSNSHAIIEALPDCLQSPVRDDTQPLALLLSARSLAGLRTLALRHVAALSEPGAGFDANAWSATSFHARTLFSWRLLLVSCTVSGWIEQLLNFTEDTRTATFMPLVAEEGISGWQASDSTASDTLLKSLAQQAGRQSACWDALIAPLTVRALLPVAPFEGERCWHSDATGYAVTKPHNESDTLWQTLCEAGSHCASSEADSLDLSLLPEEEACIDALHRHYVSQMLQQLGVFTTEHVFLTLDELMTTAGIPARYYDLLQRLMRSLAASGALQVRDDADALRYGALQADNSDTQHWLLRMREQGFTHLASLIERTGPGLGAMLTGARDAVSLVFPAAGTEDVEHMYQQQSYSVYFNQIAARILAALAETTARPLRILEVGAGTGGTTYHLLQALPAGRCSDYCFTDVGPLFLQRAKIKFAAWPFMRFAVFDMEQSAVQQHAERYDVIVAANVLHNASCLRQVLDNVKALLAPGGILLMREITAPKKLFDFVFGPLVPVIRDTGRRDGELFPSLPVWQSVLQEAGFDRVEVFPSATLPTAALGEHILIARAEQAPAKEQALLAHTPARLLSVNSDVRDADGQPVWSATHLLQTALATLPGCWRLSPESLRWYASPQGASEPLMLSVYHQEPMLAVSAAFPGGELQKLFDVRLLPARVTASIDETVLPVHLPEPFAKTGALYRWQWQPCSLDVPPQHDRKLLLIGDDALLAPWRDALNDAGWQTELLTITAACAMTSGELAALLQQISRVCLLPDTTAVCADDITEKMNFMLLQSLLNAAPQGLQLVILASDFCQVTQQDSVTHWQHAGLCGLMAVARHEYTHLKLLMLDYGHATPTVVADSLPALLSTASPLLAWRTPDGQHDACWMQPQLSLMPLPLPAEPAPGRHIITGALSPLGLILITWLADYGITQLVLLTHRSASAAELEVIRDVQARGVQIDMDSQADATDPVAFAAALERLATGVQTGGIWHLAGVLHDTPVSGLNRETLESALKVKIMPAMLFNQWESRLCPAQTLYFSSAATVFGPTGQAAHTAACATLEALAQHRTRQGYDTLALCWGMWQQTGNRRDPAGHLQARGMQAMPTTQALALLRAALGGDSAVCVAMRVNWPQLAAASMTAADNALFARMPVCLADPQLVRKSTVAESVSTDFSGSSLTQKVRGLIAEVLQCPPEVIEGETRLVSLGLDSLLFLELSERLKKELGLTLNAETAFNTNTLNALVAALCEHSSAGSGDSAMPVNDVSGALQRHPLLHPALSELERTQRGWQLADGSLVAVASSAPLWLNALQRSRWHAHDSMTRHLYVEYNKPVSFDIARFETAWNSVIARHDLLRATLDDKGIINIAPTVPWYHIRLLDWRGLSAEQQQRERAALRERMSHQRSDLTSWPHFELCVSQTEETQRCLHLHINTLLIDIESFQVMLRELNLLFHEPCRVLPALLFTAADYQAALLALAGTDAARADEENCLWPPAPELPRITNSHSCTDFVIWRDTLAREQWLRIRAQAESAGLSGSAVLLALYGLALRQWVQSDSFTLRLDCTDRLPLHAHVMNLVIDATTCIPVTLDFTRAENFIALARSCDSAIDAQLNATLPGSGALCASPAVLPVAFTSLLGVRKTYAIPETSDPLLGMPAFEYASQPHTHLHLQALEEENALLFNIDALQDLFPPDFGDILMLTLKQLLETLALLPDAWQLPLEVLLPPDESVRALAMSALSPQTSEEGVS